jgi:hypothetical protein
VKKPYHPTRTCPHRWCKPLHLAPAPFFLASFAFDLWHNWVFLVYLFMAILGGTWVTRFVHFKRQPRSGPVTVAHVVQDLRESPTALDLEMEDAKYEGTGWRMLEVRKGWARVAVACDALIVLLVGAGAMSTFADPAAEAKHAASATIDAPMVIGLLVGMAFFGFDLYAHKKATQPRKPKRAWVPAFMRTNV